MSSITFLVALIYFGRALLFGTSVIGWTSIFVPYFSSAAFKLR